MAVCVLQVPRLIKHTTNMVNHKIVKAMAKEDVWPMKFTVSREEKVNSSFVITRADPTITQKQRARPHSLDKAIFQSTVRKKMATGTFTYNALLCARKL